MGWNPICVHFSGIVGTCPLSLGNRIITYWCKSCRKHLTVTTKTVMNSRKTSLQNWVVAIYSIMMARKSVRAMQLSKELGVDYKKSWNILFRVREVCAIGSLKLDKVVKVDETCVDGKRSNMSESKRMAMREAGIDRGAVGKVPVMGTEPVENADTNTVAGFVTSSTNQSATVYTDVSRIYGKIPNDHDSVFHSVEEYVRDDVHTYSTSSEWVGLKRLIQGTWQHVKPKHLPRYVNETLMRLNIGDSEKDIIGRVEALIRRIWVEQIKHRGIVS